MKMKNFIMLVLLTILLYIPFRIASGKYGAFTTLVWDDTKYGFELPDNYFYWHSVLIWPCFAFCCGLVAASLMKRKTSVIKLVAFALIWPFILGFLPNLDGLLFLESFGEESGFVSATANRGIWNTRFISVIVWPFTFWITFAVLTIIKKRSKPYLKADLKNADLIDSTIN